ncbi:hypothetical protein IT400_02370 [Candidatus Nomurabacteria bacterium]|nr:hypothetical protein [Candidatus Nomurabacteria bacterium]
MSQKNKLYLLIFSLIISIFLPNKYLNATGGNYFGGRIVSIVPCTCSIGYQVGITGPGTSTGTYLYTGFSTGYRNYLPSFGRNILGGYTPGGICMVGVAPICEPLNISKGTFSFFGVSF